jgi:hypothetical protein
MTERHQGHAAGSRTALTGENFARYPSDGQPTEPWTVLDGQIRSQNQFQKKHKCKNNLTRVTNRAYK